MASFTTNFIQHLKENLKKNVQELKALMKRDLFHKSEFNTLPRLAAYAGVVAGFIGYFFVPFPLFAGAALASTATGFVISARKEPKERLTYTALGSAAPFALPGAITGGIVLGLQLAVMFAVKAGFNIHAALKSAAKDKPKKQKSAKEKTEVKQAPVTAPVIASPAAPAFNTVANENKPAEKPATPAPAGVSTAHPPTKTDERRF